MLIPVLPGNHLIAGGGYQFVRARWREFLWALAVFTLAPSMMWAATATTTTLALSAGTLAHGSALTLTATVAAGATEVHPGTVTFCDTSFSTCLYQAVVGQAQLTSSGTAAIKIMPAIGSHTYQAQFRGTTTNTKSSSSDESVTVTGTYPTAATISSSGSAGSYTLTGHVVSRGSLTLSPTGTVTFEDASNGNYSLGSVTLGAGAFSQSDVNPGSSSSVSVPRGVAVGDFNGDGIPDVVVANQNNDNLTVLLGKGDGTFTSASGSPLSTLGETTVGVVTGDFNNDGKIDIVATNYTSDTISIFLGNGDGTFQATVTMTVANGPEAIVAADFNNDGNLDLAIAQRFE